MHPGLTATVLPYPQSCFSLAQSLTYLGCGQVGLWTVTVMSNPAKIQRRREAAENQSRRCVRSNNHLERALHGMGEAQAP